MGTARDIIIHVDVEIAERRRVCHHNRDKDSISMGRKCLVIREVSGGRKNYCPQCALEILLKAGKKLALLQQEMQS